MEEKKKLSKQTLLKALGLMGIRSVRGEDVTAFRAEEDGMEYEVWRVETEGGPLVLKREKANEIETYRAFFPEKKAYAPAFLGDTECDGERFFLLEYIEGETLTRCTRERLVKALDALIEMQDEFWQREEYYDKGLTLARSAELVSRRGDYLEDERLEEAFALFMRVYKNTPLTLCHDDLLPFNLLVGERAVLFDFEMCGMLPYPQSFARLIAHTEEREDAFFCMTREDYAFAIEYYYENLVKKHGVAYPDYRRTLDFFLFYEYCEWVMLGNRYDAKDDERYSRSLSLAKECAERLLGE